MSYLLWGGLAFATILIPCAILRACTIQNDGREL
jgi:hypothetical protein